MAFRARIIELGKVFTEVDENKFDMGVNDIEESDVKEIIMIHPDLLKVFAALGKKEKNVEIGIADTNDASPEKNKSGDFKRSLDAMTEILGKNKEKTIVKEEKTPEDGRQKEIVD